jgi:hypothetical protein
VLHAVKGSSDAANLEDIPPNTSLRARRPNFRPLMMMMEFALENDDADAPARHNDIIFKGDEMNQMVGKM